MNMPFQDRVIIVTGGSSGIGRAAALQFAQKGARVLITGRRFTPLKEAAGEHPHIEPLVADAGKPEDASQTIERAVELWGRVDVLVNNAGAGAEMPLEEATAGRITGIFATNVLGPTLLAKAALPYLEATGGSIVNVSSTFGHRAAPGLGHYAASKAALEHLTRCWALELAPRSIRVNAVAPGPTETAALEEVIGLSPEQAEAVKERERNTIPLGRRGEPEEVARWIVHLAGPASTWMTGQVVSIDGGFDLVA